MPKVSDMVQYQSQAGVYWAACVLAVNGSNATLAVTPPPVSGRPFTAICTEGTSVGQWRVSQ